MNNEFIGIICDGNRSWAMKEFSISNKQSLSDEQIRIAYSNATDCIDCIIHCAEEESVGTLAFWGLSERNVRERDENSLRIIWEVMGDFFKRLHNQVSNDPQGNTRFVHMGKSLDDLPSYATEAVEHLKALIDVTRERIGLLVAFCLRYEGEDEISDARSQWLQSDTKGNIQDYLWLPQKSTRNFQSVDAVIRTAVEHGQPIRKGLFLHAYERYETAIIGSPIPMPVYNAQCFRQDLCAIRNSLSKVAGE